MWHFTEFEGAIENLNAFRGFTSHIPHLILHCRGQSDMTPLGAVLARACSVHLIFQHCMEVAFSTFLLLMRDFRKS